MRINKFLAQVTGISRRAADTAIEAKQVLVNEQPANPGHLVIASDIVSFHGETYTLNDAEHIKSATIVFHKPAGFVVSRNGQGSKTIYDLLPPAHHHLKPIGRLDKDSSGLLLLTNDGTLAHELTHPSRHKVKRYEVSLNKALQPLHRQMINDFGIQLDDGLSQLQLDRLDQSDPQKPQSSETDTTWLVTMHEGRNRQIRRTFAALGYEVTRLHRIQFGDYFLDTLEPGKFFEIK